MQERETKGTATERFAAQRETVPPRRTERSTLRAPQGPIRLIKSLPLDTSRNRLRESWVTESSKRSVGGRVRKIWRKLECRRRPRAAGKESTCPPARR